MVFILSSRVRQLLMQMDYTGYTTRKDQEFYDSNLGFYMIIWKLRDYGLVYNDGEHNNQKKWMLTERGKKVTNLVKRIDKLLNKPQADGKAE